jgi:hypothetical protein
MEPEKISSIISGMKVDRKQQEGQAKKEKQKKYLPVVPNVNSRIPTSMHAMELSLIFNTSSGEREKRACERVLKNGYYIRAVAPTDSIPGQPGLIKEEDLSTLLVCFLLLQHSGAKPSKYTFETTPYQITKLFGGTIGGENYTKLKNSLDRLVANYVSTNFWWDKVLGQRIDESNFHFLEGVDKGQDKALRITLGSKIVESLEKGYLRILEESDLKHIIKLRGHAKVLALFFIKLLGYKTEQTLNLKTVLRYLGMEEKWSKLPAFRFNRNVKRSVIPSMEKASSAIGFSCAYNKDKQQFHLRRAKKIKQIVSHREELSKGAGAKRGEQERENERGSYDPLLTQRKNEAFKNLIDIGVASEMIIKLFDESDIEEIERQIEWLPYRKSDNPAGILVSAIHGQWIMPQEYEQRREESLSSRES